MAMSMAEAGRKGGLVRSEAKRQAARLRAAARGGKLAPALQPEPATPVQPAPVVPIAQPTEQK